MAKKTHRPQFATPGIAQQAIKRLQEFKSANVVDLGLFRQARDLALQQQSEAARGLEEFHPLHALYTYVLNTVTDAAGALSNLPEFAKLADRAAAAEDEYMPSGPPMSPITRSYFNNWMLFDMNIGIQNESFGSCVAAVSKALGSHPSYVAFVEQLCRTRPGLYVQEGRQGDLSCLRELVTNLPHRARIPSGYVGQPGDLLLLRLLPSFLPEYTEALALTTPYQILWPRVADWDAYFERTLSGLGGDKSRAYAGLMKRGTGSQGPRYWTEYIFEAYANHVTEVVYLEGLPDVPESRPHANAYSRKLAEAKLAAFAAGASARATRRAHDLRLTAGDGQRN